MFDAPLPTGRRSWRRPESLGHERQRLAQARRVPATQPNEIVKERRLVTPDTALRLARYFGGDARSWLNLQAEYDLKIAEAEKCGLAEQG